MSADLRGKHLLVLNATYRDKVALLAAARAMGLVVSVIAPELPTWARPYVDRFAIGDPDDAGGIIAVAAGLAAERAIDGVISLWDRDVPLCARVAGALGLPGCDSAAAERVRHKYRVREALRAAGIAQPRYAEVRTWDELVAASDQVGFPLVYKPVGASASRAILKVGSPDELAAAHSLMQAWATPSVDPMFANHAGVRMVEEFMDGIEVSVEGLVARGRTTIVGTTRKWTTDDWFLEVRHAFPADLPAEVEAEASRLAADAVAAIGLDNCAFHAEIKVTARGCRIVEVNGRLGSDYIATRLVPLATGYDMPAANLRVALGREPGERRTRSCAACVRFLFAGVEGVVAGWDGVERAARAPGVVEVAVEKAAGEHVWLPPRRFTESRLARVIAEGATLDEAVRRADSAAAELDCRIEPAATLAAGGA